MKKILVLSDIHGHVDVLGRVLSSNPGVSLILIAGDLTNFGDAEAAARVIGELKAAPGSPGIALVPGNCDTASARREFEASGFCVDGRRRGFSICNVAGTGGGLRRAGITSFERTEKELGESLKHALNDLASEEGTGPLVILTHSPPYGTNADSIRESHSGSLAFAEIMNSRMPELWVCGHIHESRCVSMEDGTLVINPGPCASGCYAIIEIKEGPGLPKLAGAYLSL